MAISVGEIQATLTLKDAFSPAAEKIRAASARLFRDQERQAKEAADNVKRAMESSARAAAAAQEKAARDARRAWDTLGPSLTSVGTKMTALVSIPIAAVFGGSAKAAIDFESAMANVRKTVGSAETTAAGLDQKIRDMAKSLPMTTEELASIAATAGQFGVKAPEVAAFTRTIAALGVAVNGISAEEAAAGLAKIGMVADGDVSKVDEYASALVHLGNSSNSTEGEILEFTKRLVGAGKTMGLTVGEAMALGTAMADVGINAETGGTAMSTVMVNIIKAVSEGGDALDNFAKAANVSSQAFADAVRNEPVKAMQLFISGLSTSEERGVDLIKMLDGLGVEGTRMRQVLLNLANAGTAFDNSLRTATEGVSAGNKHFVEAEAKYATTASQLKILWNNIKDVGITIGSALLPGINSAIKAAKPFIDVIASMAKWFADLPGGVQAVALALAGLAAGAGPMVLIIGKTIEATREIMALRAALIALASAETVAGIATIEGALARLALALGRIGAGVGVLSLVGVGVAGAVEAVRSGHGYLLDDTGMTALGGAMARRYGPAVPPEIAATLGMIAPSAVYGNVAGGGVGSIAGWAGGRAVGRPPTEAERAAAAAAAKYMEDLMRPERLAAFNAAAPQWTYEAYTSSTSGATRALRDMMFRPFFATPINQGVGMQAELRALEDSRLPFSLGPGFREDMGRRPGGLFSERGLLGERNIYGGLAIGQGVMDVWGAAGDRSLYESSARRIGRSALAGMKAGAMFGPIGMGVGAAAGAITGWLRGKSQGEKTNDVRDEFFAARGGFEGLAKAGVTEEIMKKLFDAKTVEQFEAAVAEAEQAMGGLAKKAENATKFTSKFPGLLSAISASGKLASRDTLDMIDKVKASGKMTAEVAEFTKQQLTSAAGGVNKYLGTWLGANARIAASQQQLAALEREYANASGDEKDRIAESIRQVSAEIDNQTRLTGLLKITSQDSFNAMSAVVAGAFGELVSSGMSAKEAIELLFPSIESLTAQMELSGFTGNAAFDRVRAMAALMRDEVAGPALDAMNGLGMALIGLNNVGLLNQETFSGLTGQIASTFNGLIAQGYDGNSALALMQPTLQTIWELQEDFGFSVDETTAKMLEQAEAAGLVGEAHRDVDEQIVGLLEEMVKLLGDFIEQMGNIPDANVDINVSANLPDLPDYIEIPVHPKFDQDYDWGGEMAGGGFGTVRKPTLFLAGEAGPEEFAFSGANRHFEGGAGEREFGGSRSNVHDDEVHQEVRRLTAEVELMRRDMPRVIGLAIANAMALER